MKELRRLEQQIQSLLEFKQFQQRQNLERDARERASYQASILAALGAPPRLEPPAGRPVDLPALERRPEPPAGRTVTRAVPVLPPPRVRPPTYTRLPPAPLVA